MVVEACAPVARFVPVNVEFRISAIGSGDASGVVRSTITGSVGQAPRQAPRPAADTLVGSSGVVECGRAGTREASADQGSAPQISWHRATCVRHALQATFSRNRSYPLLAWLLAGSCWRTKATQNTRHPQAQEVGRHNRLPARSRSRDSSNRITSKIKHLLPGNT